MREKSVGSPVPQGPFLWAQLQVWSPGHLPPRLGRKSLKGGRATNPEVPVPPLPLKADGPLRVGWQHWSHGDEIITAPKKDAYRSENGAEVPPLQRPCLVPPHRLCHVLCPLSPQNKLHVSSPGQAWALCWSREH